MLLCDFALEPSENFNFKNKKKDFADFIDFKQLSHFSADSNKSYIILKVFEKKRKKLIFENLLIVTHFVSTGHK